MHLEDIYIRPQFRRKGIGFLLLEELAKIAYAGNLPFIEWQVLRSNYGAIKFYKRLSGLIDETDGKEENKCNLWRLSAQSFDHVLQKEAKQKESGEELIKEIYLDEGEISESNSLYLAEQWNILIASQKNGEEEENKEFLLDKQSLAKFLNSGLLGVIVAKKKENNKIVGMAFFHRKGYSTWQGRFLILDNIFVVDSEKEKGIGTSIMAELLRKCKLCFFKQLCA
uniref:N-acetyltransferase domain-containing protein n=1 Tax=Meloidogyne javanica TaxID=6303 RepID=A0A915N868_MELJA